MKERKKNHHRHDSIRDKPKQINMSHKPYPIFKLPHFFYIFKIILSSCHCFYYVQQNIDHNAQIN